MVSEAPVVRWTGCEANITTITRRDALAQVSCTALSVLLDSGARASPANAVSGDPALLELSATQAVELMSRGDLAAERYAAALLARCAAQQSLNAFITLEPQHVLAQARAADRRRATGASLGLLHGLPIPVKDSLNTRDYPTTGGTPALRTFRPAHDAPIVSAMIRAGGIVLGKTNLSELSWTWTSNNLAFGAVHNPYDARRIPGGSSGGTAAAVAARMAPLGVAEDTEGSIRVPAALCGLTGFRPTTHRYSTRGAVPISPLFDQVGPVARTVRDLVLFDAVASADQRPISAVPLKGTLLAVARGYFFADLDPQVEQLTDLALAKLRAAGAVIVEADLPDLATLIGLVTDQVQSHDIRIALPRYLRTYGAGVGFDALVAQASADVRESFARDVLPGGPGFVSEQAYRAAVHVHLPRLRRLYREYFARTGAMAVVFPTTMVTAPLIGEDVAVRIAGHAVPFEAAMGRNIAPASTAGLPGLVLPIGTAENGLPVGLEFDGPAASDRTLLGLGLSLEGVFGPAPPPRLA